MTPQVFDPRPCLLGEGPLWHPEQGRLYWFDIFGRKLLAEGREWTFDRAVSAAGWVDRDRLLIATSRNLILFDTASGSAEPVAPLEADNDRTRSNDGRADPQGGFWIGTMGHRSETGAGALYRYFRGEIRQLRDKVTIPNATCFTPDGRHAYFADTAEQLVWRYNLDAEGWPEGAPEIYLDHRGTDVNPDGAVVDASGRFWCAEWGSSRVAGYDPQGRLEEIIDLPVPQPTCPAFGDGGMYITTALKGSPGDKPDRARLSGQTLLVPLGIEGQVEHKVIP